MRYGAASVTKPGWHFGSSLAQGLSFLLLATALPGPFGRLELGLRVRALEKRPRACSSPEDLAIVQFACVDLLKFLEQVLANR